MHNFLAGLMGVFAGVGSFFHGGQPAHAPMTNNTVANSTASPSAGMRHFGKGNMQGERPFFGTVTAVNGSILTLTMTRAPMMMHPRNPSITPTITLPAPKTITITLDSSTSYTGGSQSDITTGTKIAGIGKTTSAGNITAMKIMINPTLPTGFPSGMPGRGFHGQGGFQRGMHKNDKGPGDDQP